MKIIFSQYHATNNSQPQSIINITISNTYCGCITITKLDLEQLGNLTHYSKSKRGGCSDCGFAWLDLKIDVPPLPLPLPLPLIVEKSGASFDTACSFLLESNMDPRSIDFVLL